MRLLLPVGLAFCSALALMPGAFAQSTNNQPPPPVFAATPGARHPNYDAAAHAAIPLTPGMVAALARRVHGIQRAEAAASVPQSAIPETRSIAVTFGPAAVTNIVQTVQGYPSSISFIDSSGAPWPVAWSANSAPGGAHTQSDQTGGSCTAGGAAPANTQANANNGGIPAVIASGFDVCVPYKGSNTLEIMPMSRYPRGGLLVNLKGAPAPLTFLLISSKIAYDARIAAQVNGPGPEAKPSIISEPGAPQTGAPYLTAMLDGTPPASAVPLAVAGASPEAIRAWRYDHHLFVRTRYTVLSPEWTASEHSVGGVGIYVLPDTPVVLLSSAGHTFSVSFKED